MQDVYNAHICADISICADIQECFCICECISETCEKCGCDEKNNEITYCFCKADKCFIVFYVNKEECIDECVGGCCCGNCKSNKRKLSEKFLFRIAEKDENQ